MTDSATVYGWLQALLTGNRRIKTRGLGQALAQRRLGLIRDIIQECGTDVTVELVKSAVNKADCLTRVLQQWLKLNGGDVCCVATNCHAAVEAEHVKHHLGVERTWYLVKLHNPNLLVTKDDVEKVVSNCARCKSVDPSAVRWEVGELSVDNCWVRLASDVTHYGGKLYLTVIDCGPSRFSIWREVCSENSAELNRAIESIFREHGPPEELLVDNGASFRSYAFRQMCDKWGVLLIFRGAYRPSGNGIAERAHRTMKRMAARSKADVLDMVYWMNITPKIAQDKSTVPANQLHCYSWRSLNMPVVARESDEDCPYRIGQRVFVKPARV